MRSRRHGAHLRARSPMRCNYTQRWWSGVGRHAHLRFPGVGIELHWCRLRAKMETKFNGSARQAAPLTFMVFSSHATKLPPSESAPPTCRHCCSERATRQCYTSMLHVNVTRQCYTSMLHVNVTRQCYTSMLHVNATRQCYTSMLHVNATRETLA